MRNLSRLTLISLISVYSIVSVCFAQSKATACYGSFPPYSYLDNKGNVKGQAFDLFRAILNDVDPDIKLDVMVVPFARCLQMLESGQVDFIPMLALLEQRQQFTIYSKVYEHTSVVISSNQPALLNLQTLEQVPRQTYRLVKPRGTFIWPELAEQIENGMFAEVSFTVDHEQAFSMIAAGRADMVLIERYNAATLLQQNGYSDIKIGDGDIFRMPLHIGVSKRSGYRDIVPKLNRVILDLPNKRYFHQYRLSLSAVLDSHTDK